MHLIFRSLRVRNYRLFAGGQVVSLTGTWMQAVGQDWLVLQLTNSPTALGITMALQFLPMLLFGLWGGLLADRYPKRRVLIAVQAVMGVLALTLGVLSATGVVRLWMVYVLAAALGIATVVDNPTRQSFVSEMVGPDDVANAVALNSAIFNTARILGPAVAGAVIGWAGVTPVFFANAVSYAAVIVGLSRMRDAELLPRARVTAARGQVREGLRYVRARGDLLLVMLLVAAVATFGMNFRVTLALMAKGPFHAGAGTYGALSALLAGGALAGALFSARRRRPSQGVLVASAVVFGSLEMALAAMPSQLLFSLLLVPTGAAVIVFSSTANASVQLGSSDEMRGRTMALYALVFLGGTPLGGPLMGWLAEAGGPRLSLVVGGAISTAAALAVGVVLLRRGGLTSARQWWRRRWTRLVPVGHDALR